MFVWLDLPPLYQLKEHILRGYRSLGCEPYTKLEVAGGPEQAGRDQKKEEIMKRLRGMGYF